MPFRSFSLSPPSFSQSESFAFGAQAPDPRPRLFEMRLKAGRLPNLEFVPLAYEHGLAVEPQRRLQPLLEKNPALRVEAQNLAHAEKRGRERVAGGRVGRHGLKQRVDLGDERVAAAVERRRVERRIGVDPGEAILRQHLAERRGNRDSPLGVEAMDEVGEKSIHHTALRRAGERSPDASRRSATAHRRGQLTGWRGIAWDPMGVNESEGIPAPGTPPPDIRGC